MSRCDIGIRAIQWLGRVVSHVATRHTTHSHIHTTASLYELTVNSSRVVSPLCSIAAVHQHRVTRQAAQCLSSCVPPLPPLRPLVAVSSLTAVVLRLSVRPAVLRLHSSTSALCSAACRFARPPTSLRCWCELVAVGCSWSSVVRVGSSQWEHCALFLSIVYVCPLCLPSLYAFSVRSRCGEWCFMASLGAVCSCCLYLDTSCGCCAERRGAVESSDLVSSSASAFDLISRAVQRSSFIHE